MPKLFNCSASKLLVSIWRTIACYRRTATRRSFRLVLHLQGGRGDTPGRSRGHDCHTEGRFGGYGFYVLKGKPVFLWNLLDFKRVRWEGRDRLSPGKHTLEFEFDYHYDGLVSCPINKFTDALDFREDGIGGGGPDEGTSVLIVVLHIFLDFGRQFPGGGSSEYKYGEGSEHSNVYGGSTEHAYGGATSHSNVYGGTTTGKYGYGAEHTNPYGGSTYANQYGAVHTNPYGGTTFGAYGYGAVHTSAYGATAYHQPYHGAYYSTYHPPTVVNYYGTSCSDCGGWSTAGAAAAGAMVGMAARAAVASANTSAASSNAYQSGYAAGSAQGYAAGTANASYSMGAIYATLPSGCVSPNVGGTTYYLCGNTWFQPSYGANGVYYRVVPSPGG